jgi:hypothetical protein
MEEKMMKTTEKYSLEDILKKIFLGIAVVFLILSAWGVYSALNDVIRLWIGYKLAPVYKALLNLAVLILAIYIINLLVKGRDGERDSRNDSNESSKSDQS